MALLLPMGSLLMEKSPEMDERFPFHLVVAVVVMMEL
jgi:hypothetical protein